MREAVLGPFNIQRPGCVLVQHRVSNGWFCRGYGSRGGLSVVYRSTGRRQGVSCIQSTLFTSRPRTVLPWSSCVTPSTHSVTVYMIAWSAFSFEWVVRLSLLQPQAHYCIEFRLAATTVSLSMSKPLHRRPLRRAAGVWWGRDRSFLHILRAAACPHALAHIPSTMLHTTNVRLWCGLATMVWGRSAPSPPSSAPPPPPPPPWRSAGGSSNPPWEPCPTRAPSRPAAPPVLKADTHTHVSGSPPSPFSHTGRLKDSVYTRWCVHFLDVSHTYVSSKPWTCAPLVTSPPGFTLASTSTS